MEEIGRGQARGAQDLGPRRKDWILGALGRHERCLNKKSVSSKIFKELVQEQFRYAET